MTLFLEKRVVTLMKPNHLAKKIAVVLSSIFLFSTTYTTPTYANPECSRSAPDYCIAQGIDGGGGVGGSLCAGRYCAAFKRVAIR